jgi:hypothetical protein
MDKHVKPREGNYTEITVERRGKPPLKGLMWFEDESVVVESEDGRHKAKPIDHVPPEEAAKQTLIELEQERSRNAESQDRDPSR